MNKYNALRLAVFTVAIGGCALASAELVTGVGVTETYDSNIYTLESNDVDSWITVVRPSVEFRFNEGAYAYSVGAEAASGIYSQSKEGHDNYTDYKINAQADMPFDQWNQLQLNLAHAANHDARGTGRMDVAGKQFLTPAFVVANDASDPDEWASDKALAQYQFGSKDALLRLVLSGGKEFIDYTNNSPSTDGLDKTNTEYGVVGYMKVLPKTSVFVETRFVDINYKQELATTRDSAETRYFLGAEWEATARTTGSVRLGYQQKNPDAAGVKSYNSTAWEADVIWKPRSYSSIRFNTLRSVGDSSSAVASVDDELYRVGWSHDWSTRLSTELYFQRDSQSYQDVSGRKDTTDSFGLSGRYAALPWLALKAGYDYANRGSNIAGLDYDRNTVMFGVETEFK